MEHFLPNPLAYLMKIKVNNISGLVESNNFLRALWAELRYRFGKCAWLYQPHKVGKSQTIFLGWADINQKQSIPISLTYSQKSIVSGIYFGALSGEHIEEASNLGQQLKDAVNKAYQHRNNPDTVILQVPVSSLHSSLAYYSGEWFEISPKQHPFFLLTIKLKAFDEIDAEAEVLRLSSYVLDVLSVETNSLFWLLSQEESQDIASDIEPEELLCPTINTFVGDEKWMEDIPHCNEYLVISSQAVQFLDRILSKEELNNKEKTFIRSCHHFHVAREQEVLTSNRLLFSGERKNEEGSTSLLMKKDPRFKLPSKFSTRNREIATVLYMSTIEVASKIDFDYSKKCKACGQNEYKISARVVDYVKKYLLSEEESYFCKIFKAYYSKRSNYLHEGVVLIDHSSTGTTIPQLNPSSDSGVFQSLSVDVHSLRDWVGYMLRQQLKSI